MCNSSDCYHSLQSLKLRRLLQAPSPLLRSKDFNVELTRRSHSTFNVVTMRVATEFVGRLEIYFFSVVSHLNMTSECVSRTREFSHFASSFADVLSLRVTQSDDGLCEEI